MELIYSIEFTLNQLTGYFNNRDPSGVIVYYLVLAILVVATISTLSLFKKYKTTKENSTLSWALAFLFTELAAICMVIETISYTILGQPDLGKMMSVLNMIFTTCAIINLDNFALIMTYPNKKNKILIIVAILGIIAILLVIFANTLGYPYSYIQGFLLIYDVIISYFIFSLILPNFIIGPTIFFYFASKIREENRPKSNLSLWIGIGLTCFGLGYLLIVIPILAIPLSIFLASTIIMYICFSMPEWFKNKIGWES